MIANVMVQVGWLDVLVVWRVKQWGLITGVVGLNVLDST